MSKGLVLLGLAAAAGIGFAVSQAKANSTDESAPMETVTGDSGTVYGVRLRESVNTPNGVQLTFQVFDAAGLILEYSQFQGNNDSRILVLTPDAPHKPGSRMWVNAVQDFGIFTSIPGLTF